MSITERRSGDVTVLELEGRLTLDDGVAELHDTIRTLLEQGSRQILLHYDLDYADAAGLAELVRTSATVKNHGGTVKLLCRAKGIGRPGLTAMTELLTVFEAYEEEPKALASFRGDQS